MLKPYHLFFYFVLKLIADPSILLLNMAKKEVSVTTDMNNLCTV